MKFENEEDQIYIDMPKTNANIDVLIKFLENQKTIKTEYLLKPDDITPGNRIRKKAEKDNKFKAPNNTSWFLQWLEDEKIKQFTLQQLLDDSPTWMTKEKAEDIIAHQLVKEKLFQLNSTTFKVR